MFRFHLNTSNQGSCRLWLLRLVTVLGRNGSPGLACLDVCLRMPRCVFVVLHVQGSLQLKFCAVLPVQQQAGLAVSCYNSCNVI
jgi:hypothetical protein